MSGLVERLRAELRGVHDALGHLEDFEVREPDLHLTRDDCRAILRDGGKLILSLQARVAELEGVVEAARRMPRKTPAAGGCATVHRFDIEAGVVWALDRELTRLDAALLPKDSGDAQRGD